MPSYHVVPISDTTPHHLETTCPCGCRIDTTDEGDMMVIHDSFDGREIIERAVEGTGVSAESEGWMLIEVE